LHFFVLDPERHWLEIATSQPIVEPTAVLKIEPTMVPSSGM